MPLKNARFSGRFERWTFASSAFGVWSRCLHLNAFAISVEVRLRVVAHHAVAFEQAVDQSRDHLGVAPRRSLC